MAPFDQLARPATKVFLKSIGAGLLAAVVVAFLVALVQFAASAVIVEWQRPPGSGGIGGVPAGLPLLAPLLGFVAGFWLQFRRNRVPPLVPWRIFHMRVARVRAASGVMVAGHPGRRCP